MGYFPSEINLNLEGHHLYEQLNKVEKDIKQWRDVWDTTYLQEIQKFLVFKKKSPNLKVSDVVLITDHKNSSNSFNTIGEVAEVLSERTVKVKYIKKMPILDRDNKLVKPAKFSFLIRPVQNLIFL